MKRSLALLFTVILLFSCAKTTPEVAAGPVERRAIGIEYVAVPTLNVLSAPKADAPVVTSYGIGETVSILARNGEWAEVRTVEGSGWVKQAELISAEQAKAIEANPVPRFLTPPVQVPNSSARGEIALTAKVNTDGNVVEVKIGKNSTGDPALAVENANALMKARFYPMIDKGKRLMFSYEHKVYY